MEHGENAVGPRVMEAIQIASYSERVSGMLGTRVASEGGLECRGRLPRSLAFCHGSLFEEC